MTSTPSLTQVGRLVSTVRKKLPAARRVGVHYEGRWTGPESFLAGADPVRVAWCPSSLAARDALADARSDETLVLLTDRTPDDLGADVMARLAKGMLFSVIPWEILKDLFGATELDRRLLKERWLADALLEAAPADGFLPIATGFLDAGTAWDAFLHHGLGFPARAVDFRALLEWASDPERISRFRGGPKEMRLAVTRRMTETLGPLAGPVFLAVEHASSPADALTIGLVCRILFHPEAKSTSELRSAAVRLEPMLGGGTVPQALGLQWADEAEGLLLSRWKALPESTRFGATRGVLDRAEALLATLKGTAGAFLSDVLPSSLEQRLRRFGVELREGLEAGGSDTAVLEALKDSAAKHLLANRNPERLEAVEMACRLSRWLSAHRSPKPGSTFFALCWDFADTGSFVDSAREHLTVAESLSELAEGYRAMLVRVAAAREEENHRFGIELARWCAAPGTSETEIPVEAVVPQILAPLAANRPVLFVVLDGMSYGVFRSLSGELATAGWREVAPISPGRRLSAIAAVPSLTEVSRTSLLCGALQRGGSAEEKPGFAKHPGLLGACRSGRPPVLFHKGDLTGPGGVGLAPSILEKLEKPENRVVGVVLNAVDDHLLKGDQLHVAWNLVTLQPLRTLLEAASTAGRLVVITADHGHVVERELDLRSWPDAGERHRPAASPAQADEIVLEGPRVLALFGGKLIAPWSERVRYGVKKNGYHGGASPQEMVVPLSVWTGSESVPEGWEVLPSDLPSWWEADVVPAPASRPATKKDKGSKAAAHEQLELVVSPPAPAGDWIDRLLASPAYEEQKGTHGRFQGADEQVRAFLTSLAGLGGQATKLALSRKMEIPVFRLMSLLSAVRRLLNVDGYPVIAFDETSGTISLNRDLLEKQFGVE